jgi:hypothetical protein
MRRLQNPSAALPLALTLTLTMAFLGGCASPDERAWGSFSAVMDRIFGTGGWSAESHAYLEGVLTVNGIRAAIPASLPAFLARRARAAEEAWAAEETSMAAAAAAQDAAIKAREAREAAGLGQADTSPEAEPPGGADPDGAPSEAPPAGDAPDDDGAPQSGEAPPSDGDAEGNPGVQESSGADAVPADPEAVAATAETPEAPEAGGGPWPAAQASAGSGGSLSETGAPPGEGAAGDDTPSAGEAARSPSWGSPGLTIQTVRITGLGPPERIGRLAANRGAPGVAFTALELEGLELHTAVPADSGAASLALPSLSLGVLRCSPAEAAPRPLCELSALSAPRGWSLALDFPAGDPRAGLRLSAESLAAEGPSAGGAAGPAGWIRAAKVSLAGLQASLSAAGGDAALTLDAASVSLSNLEGLLSAQGTTVTTLRAGLSGRDGTVWRAEASSFAASGLNLHDALAAPGALPAAALLHELSRPYGGSLPFGLWPRWDSLLTQHYSAGSWRLEGFRAEGPEGERLAAEGVSVTGPLFRGRVSDSSVEVTGLSLEFPAEPWHSSAARAAADFLGTNSVEGSLRAWKAYDSEAGTLRWRLDTLDLRDVGRLAVDVTLTGVRDPFVAELSRARLSDPDALIGAVVSQNAGLGALSLTLSGRPVVEKAVRMTADALGLPPASARAEMTSRVSTALLFGLPRLADFDFDTAMDVSEAVIAYIERPGSLTVAVEPRSALDAASLAALGTDTAAIVEFLNISVSANGGEPARLLP